MAAMSPDAQLAMSMHSITKLKHTAHQSPQKGLQQASQQFEALMLQKMLEQMRDTVPKSGLLNSQRMAMYQDMMDHQWAQVLAKRGVGLADMLTQRLQRHVHTQAAGDQPDAQTNDKTDAIAGIAVGQAQAYAGYTPGAEPARQAGPAHETQPQTTRRNGPLVDLSAASQPVVDMARSGMSTRPDPAQSMPDHVSRFVDRMAPAVQAASRKSGLPQRLIMAQAALETGWGRHEIRGDDGRPSHNVFNIKATGHAGDHVTASTAEFVGGRLQATRQAFRAYDSYQDAFADYVNLIRTPRYASVRNAPSAEAAAQQLQASGYATDPHYADKLIAIMADLPDMAHGGGGPLFSDSAPLVGRRI